MNLVLQSIFLIFLHAVKCYDMRLRLYSHPKEGVQWNFIALKSPLSSAGFEPANHYTSEATRLQVHFTLLCLRKVLLCCVVCRF
jgi:hypothetical protein